MRILWQKTPSVLDGILSGTPVNQTDLLFKPPRGDFTRFQCGSSGTTQRTILRIQPGGQIDLDAAAAVIAFRVVTFETDATEVDFEVELSGLGSEENQFYSVSGAAGFLTTEPTTIGGGYVFSMPAERPFSGWILVGCDLVGLGATSTISATVTILPSGPGVITNAFIDIGFLGFMRRWETPPFFSAEGVQLTFEDSSVSQISDGRQKYSTKGEKRRLLQFAIGPAKEEGGVIGTDEAVGGLRTIADNVGTTEPVVVVPSDTRALAPSLTMLGTFQNNISLDLIDGPHWRAPMVLEELT